MSVIVSKPEGGDFEQIQPGMYQAVCKGVFDIGLQKGVFNGEENWTQQVILTFEVDERMTVEKYAGDRFNMSKWYTASLHEKANLRKDLENWRGREFTEKELAGFDLENLVGINCTLTIKKSKTNKSVIGSIGPVMNNMDKITIEKPFKDIPEWIQDIKARAGEPPTQNDPYKDDNDIPF